MSTPASIDVGPMLQYLGEKQRRAIAAAVSGVNKAMVMIEGNAQTLCPNATGALQGSATSTPCEIVDGHLTAEVGFNTTYAAAVHENVGAKFRTDKTPLAQAKFLEKSMQVTGPKGLKLIADQVKAAVESGG